MTLRNLKGRVMVWAVRNQAEDVTPEGREHLELVCMVCGVELGEQDKKVWLEYEGVDGGPYGDINNGEVIQVCEDCGREDTRPPNWRPLS